MVTVMGEVGVNDINIFLWWKGTVNFLFYLRRFFFWDGCWVFFGEWRVLVGCLLKIGVFLEFFGFLIYVYK